MNIRDIPIYKAEAEVEGLADLIRANSSVAYVAPLQAMSSTEQDHVRGTLEKVASKQGRAVGFNMGDLYPTKSILASTVWNLNDDVFEPVETWTARHTPVNKPSNVEHVENQIVGHITNTWAIDDNGELLVDTLTADMLPDLYHLCNGGVIYTHWQEAAAQERTEELIAAIEADEKFVSMECLFSQFDYAVTSASENHIIARNNDSAFLTKHLRAYGGSGEYEGYKVGRLLRNFSFSGKGYVDRPANPDSIIFTDATPFNKSQASHKNPFVETAGVYLSQRHLTAADTEIENKNKETSNMSEEIIQAQLNEVKEALKAAQEDNKALAEKLAQADVAQYETRITELEGQVEAASKCADEDKKAKEEKGKAAEELQAKVDELTKANEELTEKVESAEAEKVVAGRIATLVEGGIAKEDATEKVETFANLNDEQFGVIAAELVKAAKAGQAAASEETTEEETSEEETTTASEEEEDSAEANASDETLENAEANKEEIEGSAASEGEEDEAASARFNIARAFADRIGKPLASDSDSE